MKKILYILSLAFVISCTTAESSNQAESNQETESTERSLVLTTEQIKVAGITTGKIEKKTISETIECSGNIGVPPENIASVSPIIGGFIKSINNYPGDFVKKGTILATLQHPDFIQLQQQYIEAKSQAEYYEQEYKRQGELTVENAASIKKMQKAKADYLHYEASYKSLKSQLLLLGVNTEKIESGDFITEFVLKAPISGTVSQLNANKGKYVNSEILVYEIINNNTINLHLRVFEKDISKIKTGQKIEFNSLINNTDYEAKVHRVGIKIDEQNRTVLVLGQTANKNQNLKPGMYINASIFINEKQSNVLPCEAIVEFGNKNYIFTKNENTFNMIQVNTGVKQDNNCEIILESDKLLNKDIVLKGSYYLLSKLEVEE